MYSLFSILQVIFLVNHSRVTLKDEPKTLNQDEEIQGNQELNYYMNANYINVIKFHF